ncbi:IclR family transcriptional regulator [Poseidonocella sp. HB161398]|uniref:IclR family transcriptional regulator n=1 Tax=Poseidonocella sp. HB161398 TaxID=2320855 RepID=UPI0011096EF8|nr:IclR family transcriptional regulator [Poseidonocella sp. HB161398]
MAEDRPQKSQTLVRGLDVIDAVAQGATSLADIARATGMTYSTTHRFAAVLAERGYLRAPRGREYELGPKLIELGFQAYGEMDIVRIAHPYLTALAEEGGATVHLGMRSGAEVVYLDKIQGNRPVEINSRIGGRRPLTRTGIGMALLLDSEAGELDEVIAGNGGMAAPAAFRARMEEYREGGYALDLGDDSPAIRCVAAPVRDPLGRIAAAISLSSALTYMPEERIRELIPVVKAAAERISRAIGYAAR